MYHGRGDLRSVNVTDPSPGPDDVLIEIHANGMCGTDLHLMAHGPAFAALRPPFILGHEFAGVVTAVGDNIGDVVAGSIVSVNPMRSCGRCRSCMNGCPNICHSIRWYGLGEPAGGLAEMAVVARNAVYIAPDGLAAREASLAEPLSVAMHAVNRANLQEGQSAVVIGCGPVGIAVALCLRARGFERIALVEAAEARRSTVQSMGFDCVLPPEPGTARALKSWNGGEGFEAAFDTAGVSAAFALACQSTARGGAIVIVALHRDELQLDARRLLFEEKRVMASMGYVGTYPEVLDLLANGRIPTEGWTKTYAMSEIDRSLRSLVKQQDIKVLIDPRF
ncbi:alcohol dehydrogenase catalytic domain-containing protein [Rhizobium sp. NZLR11]|uniref:alcohol dehydrogenase catalytic domain-containing protein n=1 Tax=Rhizobium sp. NZLR11 TaxID=2731098 RepID=UPI001C8399DA|nr:alcohol dehydrogenase catalytic domain-containing protein [Rhizobium sp. NZLR11]MBX5210476.1 alcohol dehydrogenase catalytic domain-containing protein [Rhizobium sp. NZLR11]